MGRDGSGWDIIDLWEKRGEQRGRRWRIRLWDPKARKHSVRHRDGTWEEAEAFAREESAKLRLGRSSLAGADFKAIGYELAGQLKEAGRVDSYTEEIKRLVAGAAEAGATNMRSPDFAMKVRGYVNTLVSHRYKEASVLSPATRNRYISHLRSVARYAMQAGYIDRDPLVIIKRHTAPEREKAVFTIAEMHKLVMPGVAAASAEGKRAEAFWLAFCLMAYTGCRVGEALHLRWEWIDWAARRVHVKLHPDYKLKRQKERSFPLQPELREILRGLGEKIHGWIVEDPIIRSPDAKGTWRRFLAYIKHRGVTIDGRSPHSTRHMWVATLLATGEDVFSVSRWAGHTDLKTTQGYAGAAESLRGAVETWPKGALKFGEAAAARTA